MSSDLKRGAIVGAAGAVVTALVFVIEPDIALPGPGTYFAILAVFLASFAVAVSLSFVISTIGRQSASTR